MPVVLGLPAEWLRYANKVRVFVGRQNDWRNVLDLVEIVLPVEDLENGEELAETIADAASKAIADLNSE